jgi:hypothetical protein
MLRRKREPRMLWMQKRMLWWCWEEREEPCMMWMQKRMPWWCWEERGSPGCYECRIGCLDDAEKKEAALDAVKAEIKALNNVE